MSEAGDSLRSTPREVARRAKAASRALAPLDEAQRNAALEAMALAVENAAVDLMAANTEDLRAADTGEEKLSASTRARLKLDDGKLREMVEQIRAVAALPDPLGRVLDAVELDNAAANGNPAETSSSHGLQLEKVSVPLGVLAVIFEARPDAVTQIAALALKSGNAVILKPGSEVQRTAAALVKALRGALTAQQLPADAVALVPGREQVLELLSLHDAIDLVIPRGSKALVEFVQANTRIPVLGHAEGVCHIYVDRAANLDMALRVITDAKLDYPAACNAVETVLVHREIAPAFVPALVAQLLQRGVTVHADDASRSLAEAQDHLQPIASWDQEYGAPELALGVVDSLASAVAHIHQYGSAHTESIITEDAAAAEKFLREVDAAGVYHNCSTRFADGFRYGFGAEVGISTSKLHARGPVGLEGLTTYKYLLRGHGHIAGDYRGPQARAFTHRRRPQP